MAITTRAADAADFEGLADLLAAEAQSRAARAPGLWPLAADPRDAVLAALHRAYSAAGAQPRQFWRAAEEDGQVLGASHALLLPVPPIYAGAFGPPGLILQDCALHPDAPTDTGRILLEAAEAELVAAGARILLTASGAGEAWQDLHAAQGYAPLTLYLAKPDLGAEAVRPPVRSAAAGDIGAIVALSAEHRRILAQLHEPFWRPHPEADARFGAWMTRSLGLEDRDMFVAGAAAVAGYAISQPITALHMPAGHSAAGVGIIDDFYHTALADPEALGPGREEAIRLLQTAEAARQARGDGAVFVVCPAAWHSKIDLLERAGYGTALIWSIKILP